MSNVLSQVPSHYRTRRDVTERAWKFDQTILPKTSVVLPLDYRYYYRRMKWRPFDIQFKKTYVLGTADSFRGLDRSTVGIGVSTNIASESFRVAKISTFCKKIFFPTSLNTFPCFGPSTSHGRCERFRCI